MSTIAKLVLLAATVGAATWSHAAVTGAGPSVAAVRNGWQVGYGTGGTPIAQSTRAASAGLSGEAIISDMFNVKGPRGSTAAVQAARTVGAAALRAGAMLAGPLAVAGVSTALWWWYEQSDVRPSPTVPGEWETLAGGQASTDTVYSTFYGGKKASPEATCAAHAVGVLGTFNPATYDQRIIDSVAVVGTNCAVDISLHVNGGGWTTRERLDPISTHTESWCYDTGTGALTIAPTGGLCPQGEWAPHPLQGVADRLAATQDTIDAPAVAEDIIRVGVPLESGPVALTGPATAPPRTVTTVGPEGTTTTTINNYYNYEGDTITWTETTTTTHPNGDTETKTDDSPEDETKTECEKNPKAVGCAELGEPDGDDPESEEKDVDLEIEDLGFGGACPAPVEFTLPGASVTIGWSYQGLCDVAWMIRIALLLMASLGAMVTIIRECRS